MERSNIHDWTDSNIFAHLNDFEPSIAENVLETEHNPIIIDATCVKDQGYSSNNNLNIKFKIKMPKLESTDKNYVLQCKEVMTQDFIDYLKKLSSSNSTFSDQRSGSFQIKCEYCKELFSMNDFEFHLCDLDENNSFDNRNVIKQLKENNNLIAKILKNNSLIVVDGQNNISQPRVKEIVKSKKKDGPYDCTLCDRKFIYESGLTSHMAKHALECPLEPKLLLKQVVKCLKCSLILNGDNIATVIDHFIKNHVYTVDPITLNDGYLEENDVEMTSTEDIFKCTILNSVFQCEFCELLFSDVIGLLNHSASHDPKLGFECTLCEIHVTTLKDIVTHRQSECPFSNINQNIGLQTFYVCNVCDSKFMSLEYLYEHRNQMRHLFPRKGHDLSACLKVACEKCDVVVDNAEAMCSHSEEHYVRKSRWRNFETNSIPTVSSCSNSRNRKYLCEVCGKTYTQSSHLWQHLRFHQGIKPFVCSEANCNRKFTIRPDLNDHIRKCHTGERPYHCLICGKRFLTGSVFYQHRLIHRGERRYGCDQCNKRFYRADALKNHLRIHSGERPYPCGHCSKSFRQRGDREKHIRARHSIAKVDLEPSTSKLKNTNIVLDGPVRSKKELLLRNQLRNALKMQENVVQVGGVSFPKSMFRPILADIDPNVV